MPKNQLISVKTDNPVANNIKGYINGTRKELSKKAYEFLITYCGFIAHYNRHGFMGVYDGPALYEALRNGGEMGYETRWLRNYLARLAEDDADRPRKDLVRAETYREIFRLVGIEL